MTIDVAAFMITMNFFAWAETSEAAIALGVSTNPAMNVHPVAGDEFLRKALGYVGRHAAHVLTNDLNFPAGNRIALLLHVELDAVVELGGRVGELPRVGQNDTDLDGSCALTDVWWPPWRWRCRLIRSAKCCHRFLPCVGSDRPLPSTVVLGQ